MKVDVYDTEEFVEINHLQEITSPVLFQRGDIPHPDGLVSNEIFGVTTKSRKTTFAYINLHGYFFQPHIYKAIRRMFRDIDKIVNGEIYYSLDKNGRLIKDDVNGDTGIKFLYDNWEKINWDKEEKTFGMRDERSNLMKNCKKKEIFMKYQIVIPAFYRDIKSGVGKSGETTDLNTYYCKLIRLASLIKNQDMFDFEFHTTNFEMQNLIVAIYDYFKLKLEKKTGMFRKYLMGKNCDYCTRSVITAPTYHANRPNESMVSFEYSAIPISQLCSLVYPFIIKYIKDFFEREVFDTKNQKILYNPLTDEIVKTVEIINPESYFSDKYIKKKIDTYIKDPKSRFERIAVPTNSKNQLYLTFSGKRMDSSTTAELSTIVNRPMTWTDLLFMACESSTRDKHVITTRYPLLDEFGLFITKIRVSSTIRTMPMMVNGYLYKWYPVVDLSLNEEEVANNFIDSVVFSNSYLPGIEGDYDGDQTTEKILMTQEANEECNRAMNDKANFINASGSNIRKIGKEALQTFFVLTKDPYGIERSLTLEEKKYFIHLNPEEITFEKLIEWFGNTVNIEDEGRSKDFTKSKFNPTDTLTISPAEYKLVKSPEPIKTTLGRLIFNKVLVEGLHFDHIFNFQNKVFLAKVYGGFDASIANALIKDEISVAQMKEYIDTRDWFGLQLHGIITTSFTPGVLKLPKSVIDLRKKLFEENKEALERGDEKVMEMIENQLLDLTKKELKDDIGMDLYNSGARGSVNNHLKNIMLTRGAVKNTVTGKYDIIEGSLMDGLKKKDITAHSNMIVAGAYPKSVIFKKYLRTINLFNCWKLLRAFSTLMVIT